MDVFVSNAKIQNIVKAVLTSRFPKIHVLSVNVREAASDDGDNMIEIAVVFESKKGDFDPAQVPTCIREVADRLTEEDDSRFPVLSFIAKSDLGKTKPEAA